MFRFKSKLLRRADAWAGVDTRIHQRETSYWANRMWGGLKDKFVVILNNYKIKGSPFREWLDAYGLQRMINSQDPAVRRATHDVRKLLDDYVKSGGFRQNEITAFKQQYGSNVTDWLYMLTSHKRSSKTGAWVRYDREEEAMLFSDLKISHENKILTVSGRAWEDGEVELDEASRKIVEQYEVPEDQITSQILDQLSQS